MGEFPILYSPVKLAVIGPRRPFFTVIDLSTPPMQSGRESENNLDVNHQTIWLMGRALIIQ